ncbi:2-succinyl-5-enolpyruvyl-6-hydroxy-3-cyclohexene-1-carboxylic-acid synthase [Prevotella falsenii]|uniref:2-succinyl-5-enolpyruvyl-6-hydroxy-3- cyclohexene-1-carboxylic-acid synthase n=1 Tax=Prevotella falsenii TaxID=515414 RepID=UPI00046AADB2|nr:2-succinyl-5-enolpyruvyl-6-hydroxy-3-cyclohexene-1-carboxylic-acid synthase [Prevotella falsenii]
MFSNKENVNILTALLVRHGITQAVVCPGSRNSPLVHNLCECKAIKCYPVTDERSAAFFALGVAMSTHSPVVVCVTSGSALLNVAPAVAEAYYQNLPLIVVSADRPQQWIGQSDGQTMPQANALAPFVRKSVHLIEPKTKEEHWYCNRLANEALIECKRFAYAPVHINVPISEPLFDYDVATLPIERHISATSVCNDNAAVADIATMVRQAQRPLLVIGQEAWNKMVAAKTELAQLRQQIVVLQDKLSDVSDAPPQLVDAAIAIAEDAEALRPDLIIYMGGTLVSKQCKQFLRNCTPAHSILVDPRGDIRDTFMNLTDVVQCQSDAFIKALASGLEGFATSKFYHDWQKALNNATTVAQLYVPAYSQMLAVRRFHTLLQQNNDAKALVYGNSSAVRLGNFYSSDYIFVNRGVNGIEGTLSTAAGMAAANKNKRVFCVIGDLSFFYDRNALWNSNLGDNLSILLLNNSGGGIFQQLSGLEKSAHRAAIMGAGASVTAEGVCQTHNIGYLSAADSEDLESTLAAFLNVKNSSVLLEVFTNSEEDAKAWSTFYKQLEKKQ